MFSALFDITNIKMYEILKAARPLPQRFAAGSRFRAKETSVSRFAKI